VRVAHMPDEHVPIDQLRCAAEVLVRSALRYCGALE
jgi:acetylornithine deacetylase/succinyl-diaminopimelate desuccinylase-like protein